MSISGDDDAIQISLEKCVKNRFDKLQKYINYNNNQGTHTF